MMHLTEDDCWRYVFDADDFEGKEEAEAHLRECRQCRDSVAEVRVFHEVLGEEMPYHIAEDVVHECEREPPEALKQVERQIDAEHAAAHAALQDLLGSYKAFERAGVAGLPALRTTAGVGALCDAANNMRQREPQFALSLASTAARIATDLHARGALGTPLLRTYAETEVGAALFLIGRYRNAEAALDRAEAILDDSVATSGWHLANVWLVRANIYRVTERVPEARGLASAAARQFSQYGDMTRCCAARVLEAQVLFTQRRFEDSLKIALEVTAHSTAPAVLIYYAAARQDAGASFLELQRYPEALSHLLEAQTLWEELGLRLEAIRTSRWLALIDLRTGNLEPGMRKLDEIYRALEALGVINESSLARMELAEVLLATGRPETVPALLRDVPFTFAAEGAMRNARIALAYLHEALAAGRGNADLVRHVRTYLEALALHPEERFAAPQ